MAACRILWVISSIFKLFQPLCHFPQGCFDHIVGWTGSLDGLSHLSGRGGEFFSLSRRDPGEVQPLWFDSQILYQSFYSGELPPGEQVAAKIVAVARVSAGDPDAVSPVKEGFQDELWVHPTGAGNSDHSQVGRIRQPAHASQIRRAV